VEFGLLGPLLVTGGPEPTALGGPRQRVVLAHLLLRANREVTQDQLIDAVWGDDPPPSARGSLQSYVSRLRSSLGPDRLEGTRGRYVLHAAPDEIDAARFEAMVAQARSAVVGDVSATCRTYREALDLWRGRALQDLADEPSLGPEIARLEELRLAATEDWVDAELALGRHRELVGELDSLTAQHPLRERLWAQLMLALYRSGRQAEALERFRQVRTLLDDELGISPWPALQQLHEQVLRHDPALDVVGQPLRGYRLVEKIGTGVFGTVHRAVQPDVGREVAVKVLRPELAGRPEFVRRFAADGQRVARLEHPHIVPLHDYWREPQGTYLATRYLRGGSLREKLGTGPLDAGTVMQMVQQVALALEAAHRQGVVHGDLKPFNVLFDEDGNAYVGDFGMPTHLALHGTPALPAELADVLAASCAPEQIAGGPVTPLADVYGLGVLAFEALCGRHPLAGESAGPRDPRLPPAVDGVLASALATDPADRPSCPLALADALREALGPSPGGEVAPAVPLDVRNPYKGLRPFVEADAGDFHGRRELVDEIVQRLGEETTRFVAIVGPSGCGKSSLVRAGLLPALREGRVAGSDLWFVADAHPGTHPFDELATALGRVATTPVAGLADRLRAQPTGLVEVAGELLASPSAQLLLVVDQFEEAFTLVPDPQERARYLQALVAAASDPESRVRVVVTLRADFFDLPLAHAGTAELLSRGLVSVTPLTPAELERAIVAPAAQVGVRVEPALVAALVADVTDQAASLPLLQYALTEMFDQREGEALTLAAYGAVGGVAGALARRAEHLYAGLGPSGQAAARQLFLRLVTVGEQGNRDTRRRVSRAELAGLDVDPEAWDQVIEVFGARRLITFDRDPLTRGPTIEVAHEALLDEWARLRGWIDTAREDLRAHRRLAAAAEEWGESGRDDGSLLRGDRLRRFETWASTSQLALSQDEQAYLAASAARRDAELDEAAQQMARERALERRSIVRLRAAVAVAAAFALGAVTFTLVVVQQRADAQRVARSAVARELSSASVAALDRDPELGILLATQAVATTLDADGLVLREAEEALHQAIRSTTVVTAVPQGGSGAAFSPDGSRLVTTGTETGDNPTVWDTATGRQVLALDVTSAGPATSVAFSPDGRLLLTSHDRGPVHLWDARSGDRVLLLSGQWDAAGSAQFSPDGRWVAAAGEDPSLSVWDVRDWSRRDVVYAEDRVADLAFSPDGSRLATVGQDPGVRLWDLDSGAVATTVGRQLRGASSVAFSADGRWLTVGLPDAALVLDARTGALVRSIASPAPVAASAFSPDRTRLATAGSDGVARVWDLATGKQTRHLTAQGGGPLTSVAFHPDGDLLLAAGPGRPARVWDVSENGSRDWLTVPSLAGADVEVAFSPDGSTFAAAGTPGGVTIRDATTGATAQLLTSNGQTFTTMAFAPDGARLVAASAAGAVPTVWDLRTGKPLLELGTRAAVSAVAVSPDGALVATVGDDGTTRVWDGASGQRVAALQQGGPVGAAAFSPDGRSLVTGGADGSLAVWAMGAFTRVTSLSAPDGGVTDLAFASDDVLVSGSEDGTARVWDLSSGSTSVILRAHRSPLAEVAVSAAAGLVATAAEDGTTRLWDLDGGRERLSLLGHRGPVTGVDVSPDGRLLATSSPDGTTALSLLPVDELVAVARERVTRGLTEDECARYLHLAACP
jgi:WD40 repeat protein/DNA-binding SARP family transcriptional activator